MLNAKKINIGSRGSKLALAQSALVKKLIIDCNPTYKNNPDLISITGIKTTGDKILNRHLAEIGGKGLFTKEIEEALLEKKIDIAVHSMKDMPAFPPQGLGTFAIPPREDASDAFISKKYKSVEQLPKGAVVGTSSARRKALLLKMRPDLKIVNFRGNINTRLQKIEDGEVDATILAVAGLNRVNKQDCMASKFTIEQMLPAVGQGALAVQICENNQFIADLVSKINHQPTSICIEAERAFLKGIDGSCKTPMAGYCYIKDDGSLHFRGLICRVDGEEIYEVERFGAADQAEEIGDDAALEIKKNAPHLLGV
ncbi:MAG: hydroxymethylbilane synthase [Proteobacteria bacterium]|nr:hydroxymethylbilane synthase [Pseudomonadota bacterium]